MDHQVLFKLALVLCIFTCISGQECVKGQLDVLFIFDSSSSVSTNEHTAGLSFAANLAENFLIGANGDEFGAINFADNPHNIFNLSAYTVYEDIEKAILNIQYLSGSTKTYLALERANNLLDVSEGARVGVPKVVIIFTNGKSDDYIRTQQQATILKNSGVFVIAVGTSNASSQELQSIASSSSAVFSINSFNSVLHLLQNYSDSACSQQEPCTTGQADVLFLIDSSSNVGITEYNQELRFASNLAEYFHIGPTAVQFGAITFADSSQTLFDFRSFTEFIDIEKALIYAPFLSGNANTSQALENSRHFFSESNGSRHGAPKVALVFSSGRSVNSLHTQQQAALLKNSGVYVIAVGLPNSNTQELQAIASGPEAVLSIDNFNSVLSALQNFINNTCIRAPCLQGQLDVLYVLDASATVGAADFNRSLAAAANLAENFVFGANATQFGAITFGDSPHHTFSFSTFTDYKDLQRAILNITYLSGSTNTFLALEESGKFFDASQGARTGAPKVAVVFTNGISSDSVKTAQQATILKQMNVYVIAVGFAGANRQELQSIASEPGAIFDVNNFNGILASLQTYQNNACTQRQ